MKYGTDKYPWYTPFYDALLRGRQINKVLEIGVLNCASLKMWQEFFPGAMVFGMDINRKVVSQTCANPHVFYGDQSELKDLENAASLGPFDLIVDDGSHTPQDQILGAVTLVPHLSPGGLYIIEDVNNPVGEVTSHLPFPCQYVQCMVPGSDLVGRCVVIPS